MSSCISSSSASRCSDEIRGLVDSVMIFVLAFAAFRPVNIKFFTGRDRPVLL